jgi:exopolysaccharide biosynthesis polyprenyl glycosylphosphotransferase
MLRQGPADMWRADSDVPAAGGDDAATAATDAGNGPDLGYRPAAGGRDAVGRFRPAWHPEPAGLALLDAAAVFAAALAAGSWRGGAVLAAVLVPALAVLGLYRHRLVLSALDDLFRLAGGVALAVLGAGWLGQPLDPPGTAPGTAGGWQRWLWWAALTCWVVLARAAGYALVRRVRARRPNPAVVVGRGPVLARLAQRLAQRPDLGLRPVGLVHPPEPDEAAPRPVGLVHPPEPDEPPLRPVDPEPAAPRLPLQGTVDDLGGALAGTGVRHLVVGFGAAPDSELVEPLRRFRQQGGTVYLVPRLFELNVAGATETVDGIPLLRLPPVPAHRWTWPAKRVLDVVGAAAGLVVSAPVLLACAVAVWWESGREVLFRQRRVGQHGRPFPIMKFRSLTPASQVESQQRWNIADDSRIGPVGRTLRRTSLDELPQLVNVLRGEMSLVGPRPERPFFAARFSRRHRRYRDRLRVPPGITGWAQVHGLRGDTSIEERTLLDNYYIENWSLALDVKILLRTLAVVLGSRSGGS